MARSALVMSAVTVCFAVLTAAVQAAIIPTGDAFPSGGDYFVGFTGVGDLQINAGSVLNDSSAYIGFLGGSTGTATATVAPSATKTVEPLVNVLKAKQAAAEQSLGKRISPEQVQAMIAAAKREDSDGA
jgi:hypothetical protein